jgi:hypothetical protein
VVGLGIWGIRLAIVVYTVIITHNTNIGGMKNPLYISNLQKGDRLKTLTEIKPFEDDNDPFSVPKGETVEVSFMTQPMAEGIDTYLLKYNDRRWYSSVMVVFYEKLS